MNVTVVDDHDLFREGVIAILAVETDIDVVGQGKTSGDAVRLTALHHPDVILLDVELHGDPARATIARLHRIQPSLRIIMLTMHRDPVMRMQMIKAGADSYLTKDQPSLDLITAIRNTRPMSHVAAPALLDLSSEDRSALLSPREMEVLSRIAQAKSNRTIAAELAIAEGTVKRHTTNMFRKLETRSRMQSVQKGLALGLLSSLEPPDEEVGPHRP